MTKHFLALSVLTLALAIVPAQHPVPGGDAWKYDVVYRHKGPPLSGLVVEQGAAHIVLKCIARKPGRPTIVFTEWLPRKEIARIVFANPEDRVLLARRLQSLVRERELLAARLKALGAGGRLDPTAGDALSLHSVLWVADPKRSALAYDSTYFRLVSNASPPVVELAAIHLEQVYAAFARTLPPRGAVAQPTLIVLTRSLADYHALARGMGLNLRNPAFYDVAHNRVVCASDLQRLDEELRRGRQRHDKLKAELKKTELDLSEAYGGQSKIPAEIIGPIALARKEMQAFEKGYEDAFLRARRRLFHRLFHEAFHAYLINFVYPASEGELPRWLNEGLAQIFETAIVEVGELRIGHADKERLDAVRSALARDGFPSVAELLEVGPRQFLVAHAADRPDSDRAYLASWALAFYLTFERRLLGTPALDNYARSLQRGTGPLAAFEALVGQPLTRFEKDYRAFLTKLKPDGSAN